MCILQLFLQTLGTNWGLLIYDWIVEKLRIKVAKEIKFHDFIAKKIIKMLTYIYLCNVD